MRTNFQFQLIRRSETFQTIFKAWGGEVIAHTCVNSTIRNYPFLRQSLYKNKSNLFMFNAALRTVIGSLTYWVLWGSLAMVTAIKGWIKLWAGLNSRWGDAVGTGNGHLTEYKTRLKRKKELMKRNRRNKIICSQVKGAACQNVEAEKALQNISLKVPRQKMFI